MARRRAGPNLAWDKSPCGINGLRCDRLTQQLPLDWRISLAYVPTCRPGATHKDLDYDR